MLNNLRTRLGGMGEWDQHVLGWGKENAKQGRNGGLVEERLSSWGFKCGSSLKKDQCLIRTR